MKKFLVLIWEWIKNILATSWEAPQTILGGLLFLILFALKKADKDIGFYRGRAKCVIDIESIGGLSLGFFTFTNKGCSDNLLNHEYGHCLQSMILGPLYLILVGIPSIVQLIISNIVGGKLIDNYYKRYPENWADKLGGVIR